MANSAVTKKALARSFKELLQKQPLDKISIRDITEQSGMNRNSFYYHFQDKYELMNWIFDSDIAGHSIIFNDSSKFLADSFKGLCRVLYNNKDFYLACFKYEGQNSLYETLEKLYYEQWKEKLKKRYRMMKKEIDEVELDLMAKLNTHALLGTLKDWIRGGMEENYMYYFEKNLSNLNKKECFMVKGKYIIVS